ncbi:SCP2 domain-containing protein [Aquitalea sp. LB_tupeE]|uniref:ubiquinone anaerobic biosynthesis accessory factor UbiT n=1 Tax=Aquitalea sp. LB_tupeE TaxID=2748078 RepID=UPI0015BFCDC3|nr:SCP2 sterol-binding domain-containing protein [Aquitalea sp. LB_tupeE]NWK78220.1 SCP2 sterol-binding domain-containing protein [Aquitalea sp. LB_tupeE]
MHIPDLTLPTTLANILGKLPSTPPCWALVTTLNQLKKREILQVDMSLLSGHSFEVHILDADMRLHFVADDDHFSVGNNTTVPDLHLAANLADFARMMLREEDPDTLFFNRKLVIEGDTELGLIVKNLLDSVDWSATPLQRFMAV